MKSFRDHWQEQTGERHYPFMNGEMPSPVEQAHSIANVVDAMFAEHRERTGKKTIPPFSGFLKGALMGRPDNMSVADYIDALTNAVAAYLELAADRMPLQAPETAAGADKPGEATPMPERPTCASCAFWNRTHPEQGKAPYHVAECRRRAPDRGLGVERLWPITQASEWCGEHQRFDGDDLPF